jgi:hypothetical protein
MLDLSLKADREKLEELLTDDVNTFCETFYEQGHRNHMGASGLGEECWRKLWYDFRWTKEEHFDGRMMRLFNVGHSAEPRFVAYLRGIGFEVREHSEQLWYSEPLNEYKALPWDYDTSGGVGSFLPVTDMFHYEAAKARGLELKQYRISGANGHYGGSLDGKCRPPAKYEVQDDIIISLSFKTNNTGAGYAKVATEDLRKSKPLHFAQECQYGYKEGIKYCIYMIENKNDSDITFKVLELDWNYGAELEKKATTIINAKEPPPRISDNPAFYKCRYCHQAGICHKGEVPEKNCRSCRNTTPVENAEWFCSAHNSNIPKDFIRKGCDAWLPI